MLTWISGREHQAEERLAKALGVPPEPPQLEMARQELQKAEAHRVAAFWAWTSSEKHLEEVRRTRPTGFRAWLSGRMRRHDREKAEVEDQYTAVVAALNAARKASEMARERLGRIKKEFERETALRGQAATLDVDRACEELEWTRDARACIETDPSLAHQPAKDLVQAVEKRRKPSPEEVVHLRQLQDCHLGARQEPRGLGRR
jgi:hypothetical protein